MAVILALLLPTLSKHTQKHTLTEYDSTTLRVDSLMPHLVFLVDKDANSIEANNVKVLGMAYWGLVMWLEGNLQPNWKVLFVPNEDSGVNVLGITSAYYLSEGTINILTLTPSYRSLTLKNLKVMRECHPDRKMTVNLLND